MSTVTAMHEEMHQRAGEQEQPGKPSQEMRPMLGDEVETGKDEKSDKNDVCAGDRGTLLAAAMIAVIHLQLLHTK